jgi:hypothetical protein
MKLGGRTQRNGTYGILTRSKFPGLSKLSKMKEIRDSLNQKTNSGYYYPANVLMGFFDKTFLCGAPLHDPENPVRV